MQGQTARGASGPTQTTGRHGEQLAAKWLEGIGWRIVARNLRVRLPGFGAWGGGGGEIGHGGSSGRGTGSAPLEYHRSSKARGRHAEIDLLARKRRRYMAVEVKTRSLDPAPERCVSPEQLHRIAVALERIAPKLRPWARHLQVDIVAIRLEQAGGEPEIRRFPGPAWRAGEPIPIH